MGCLNCKFYEPPTEKLRYWAINEIGKFETVQVPRRCRLGNDNVLAQWWEDNGRKPADEAAKDEPVCFVPTEGVILLDGVSLALKNMLEGLTLKDPCKRPGVKTQADIDREKLLSGNWVGTEDQPTFKEGDQVLFIPNHANGDREHPACERGVVSTVKVERDQVKIWVRYSSGSTGALTPIKNLVKF